MEQKKSTWNKIRIPVFIVAFLAIIALLQTCNSNRYADLQAEYKLLNDKYTTEKDAVALFEEYRQKEKDSLNGEITKREQQNEALTIENQRLEDRIIAIKNREFKVAKTAPALVEYFNKRYDTKDNEVIEDKVALSVTTAYNASHDLEDGDKCLEIVPLKDEQIKNQERQITNLEKDKTDVKAQLSTAELDIEKRKQLQETAQKNIDNLKDQVETLNDKNTLNKILIPAAFIIGSYAGYQIAK